MRRARNLGGALLVGSLAAVVMVFILHNERMAPHYVLAAGSGVGLSQEISQTASFTACLPLVANLYDFSYFSPFGVTMYGNVDEDQGLYEMESAGSGWVTTKFSWSAIEPTQDTYNWAHFDTKAQNAQGAGMDVYVLFTSNPGWAAELPGGPVNDIADLVDISARMAERYDCDGTDDAPGSPCVHYWSFYAEPDNHSYNKALDGKGYWGDNGDGYADMLSHVAPAIHAANPRAKVLIGGVAYDWFEPGPFVRSFLADTLAALNTYPGGADAYIDAVAFHYYPISELVWPTIREKGLEIRGIMQQQGVGHLPLLCPEAGYWSTPKFGSSEQEQAQRLVQMYARGLSIGIEILSWHKVFDSVWAGSEEDRYAGSTTGLLRVDESRKPAYYAYRAMTRELNLARYLRALQRTNVEGYVFRMPEGQEKTVLWGKTSAATVPFSYACLRRVGLTGGASTIRDGDLEDLDGVKNGQISLRIEQNWPAYVEPCP